ncbi:MAG: cob(I)yrinic acid a,c-diamide adenosyltransferase [Microgenomates group bacterium]|nr:cob(I)yrinic acid a,c-diamide adenosyltransferase [Microgenomates group bacterium]
MPLYTKTGDDGTSTLFNSKRLSKAGLVFEALGSVDELSSLLGFVISQLKKEVNKESLTQIQKDLQIIMAYLSGARNDFVLIKNGLKKIEQFLDKNQDKPTKLNRFILPQGSEESALFHFLRAVCRRSERAVVRYLNHQKNKKNDKIIIISYLNRLSDFFFVLARIYNRGQEITI